MSGGGLRYDRYRAGPHEEWMMRIGPDKGPAVLFVPPLFEEMNRTRALIAAAMRALAGRGFHCVLPDLPGTGESERALETVGWDEWRHGVAACAAAVRPAATASLRGGALLDDAAEAPCRWRLAPAEGAGLARDLERAGLAGGGALAGYPAAPALMEALKAAAPAALAPLRMVRLASDRGAADLKLDGPALWRRSEPGTAPALAEAIAADIADWAQACGAC